jgi:acylphosphatase
VIKCYSIRVSGKVQGVFYRASAYEKASSLSLTGFVRNERDGSVYIEAEGEQGKLESLVEWCRQGPPSAVVAGVEVKEESIKNFKGFEVRR